MAVYVRRLWQRDHNSIVNFEWESIIDRQKSSHVLEDVGKHHFEEAGAPFFDLKDTYPSLGLEGYVIHA